MLNENIKRIRKSKGLSQEELAIKLNVGETDCIKMGEWMFCPRFKYANFVGR